MDFAEAQVPGWHTTIFPPYFVAGAIFSGFAMVLTLAIPMRWASSACRTSSRIRHIDNCGKLLLVTGLIVAYGYCDRSCSWAGTAATRPNRYLNLNRAIGPYAWSWWMIIFCNCRHAAVLWFRQVRQNPCR